MGSRRQAHVATILGSAVLVLLACTGVALAHGGGLSGAQPERMRVPTWLFLLTGGGVVGASFLLASFVTDRAFIHSLHAWRRPLSLPETPLRWAGRMLGLLALGIVLLAGWLGPHAALQNAAILLVWVGWWAGYTMTVYLGGNSWPAINPFRTLTRPLRGRRRFRYPSRLGAWPAAFGLLLLIWLEVVSPLADQPRFLALVTGGYLVVTLVGSVLVGPDAWFARVDPVSCVFRQYGRLAPIQSQRRADDAGEDAGGDAGDEGTDLALSLPGAALVGAGASDRSEVGLVLALVWGTTYDGFVKTPIWADFARAVVGAGIPPEFLYPAVLALGYGLFLGVYWLASKGVRPLAPTYLTTDAVARRFAPSLLAIAAGYHLAHYLTYFLTLLPALLENLLTPLRGSEPSLLSLPGWTGGLAIAFVLLGHLLAIWIAHSIAYEEFPSRLQALRSQYPITAVMVLYTMLSLWIVTQPFTAPPYL